MRIARALARLLMFFALVLVAAFEFLGLLIVTLGRPSRIQRAAWLHWFSRRLVKGWQIDLHVNGQFPPSGLIVSNHLSYLDILLYSALAPCTFVSKDEVRFWPIIGLAAQLCGAAFIKRENLRSAPGVNSKLAKMLASGVPIILFAEGTSTNGSSVLPFRSPLMEPVMRTRAPMIPACVAYDLAEGSVEWDICYWGEMTFLPHVLKLLTRRGIQARVQFGGPLDGYSNRKQAAVLAHEAVVRLLQT